MTSIPELLAMIGKPQSIIVFADYGEGPVKVFAAGSITTLDDMIERAKATPCTPLGFSFYGHLCASLQGVRPSVAVDQNTKAAQDRIEVSSDPFAGVVQPKRIEHSEDPIRDLLGT